MKLAKGNAIVFDRRILPMLAHPEARAARNLPPTRFSQEPALQIPVIDLSPYYGKPRDPCAIGRLLAEVDYALCEIGFLCVTGHQVPRAAIESSQRSGIAFFDSPEPIKDAARARRHRTRGWTPIGEHTLSNSLQPGGSQHAPDLFERFRMGPFRFDENDDGRRRFEAAYAPNVWPSGLPQLQCDLSAYYEAMSALSRDLLRVFALALGLAENWFDRFIDREMSSLCLNHYPAQTTPPLPGQWRAGAHTDYGTLTIVAPTPEPGGLQVRLRQGQWIDVQVAPGTFVVNIGDMMAQWTNDRWVSTLHRVANPPEALAASARRLSLVYFHQPNPDAIVRCIPTCAGPQQPQRYEPVSAGEYIARKIDLHFRSERAI
jgi:isopenicillin N synthase-like dioxygenase